MTSGTRISSALAGRGGLIVALAVLAIFVYAAYEIQTGFATRARLFGQALVIPALTLAAAQVIREARRLGMRVEVPREAAFSRSALAWVAAFFVSLWTIGLVPAVPLFALVYLRFAAGEGWAKAAAYALAAWLFVELLFIRLLHVPLPGGAIPLPGITP